MNTTKPTPGPWRADTYLMGAFEISAEIWDHGCIVLASRARHETRADEMHANARLIAASPTLYAYVAAKATEGDADAARIIANI